MKYIPPLTKDGKIQHVPIVVKNRDFLLGVIFTTINLIENLANIIDLDNEENLIRLSPDIDSSRFNGYIEDGVDGSKMSDEEIMDVAKETVLSFKERTSHPENNNEEENFFEVDCTCGNSVSFKTEKDIPSENCRCELCDRVLIQYIHVDDEDIEIDERKE